MKFLGLIPKQTKTVEPFTIIAKYYQPGSKDYNILIVHSVLVCAKALKIAATIKKDPAAFFKRSKGLFCLEDFQDIDLELVRQGALLHDIGFRFPEAEGLEKPKGLSKCYLAHGWWGGKILKKEGLGRLVGIAENHIGAGLTKEDLQQLHCPIEEKDYMPKTVEELVVAYADLFFSKDFNKLFHERTVAEVRAKVRGYGRRSAETFEQWEKILGT